MRLLGLLLLVGTLFLRVQWGSSSGTRRDFMIGCPLAAAAAAAVLSCTVQADRWIAPHLAVRTLCDYDRWSGRVTQPVRFSPLWPASWLPRRVWEVFDDCVQFMSRQDALLLDECLNAGDVSRAWLVWSRAAEAALADAYQFSGGAFPQREFGSWTWSGSFQVCSAWWVSGLESAR